jgi:predicted dehydrogenase
MCGKLRLGLVGAGAIARAYGSAIAASSNVELVAVSDLHPAAAEAFAAETGARAYASHLDLASDSVCDAVVVTTPPVTHAPIVIDLVSRGRHVLCEKPVSTDFASAERMIHAADRAGVVFSMASKFRFADDVIEARRLIRDGAIGQPLMLENVFTGVVDMTQRWNADPDVSGGGVLIDNGTHSADIVRYLLGPIVEVFAVAAPKLQPIAVEDGVTFLARTESGAMATIETSWSIHKDRSAFISLYGTSGAIEVGWKGSRIRRAHGGPWEAFGVGYDKIASFRRQIEHFAGVVQGDDFELVTARDALASVSVIQAAYYAMATGKWAAVGAGDSSVPAIKLVV